jgi:hypothetical protein
MIKESGRPSVGSDRGYSILPGDKQLPKGFEAIGARKTTGGANNGNRPSHVAAERRLRTANLSPLPGIAPS